jgi:HSP20 family protein
MFAFDPFNDLHALRREIDRAFDAVRSGSALRNAFTPARNPRLYPAVNVAEDAEKVYVEALAPGLDPSSIQITVLRNQLTLAGEKAPLAGEIARESWHRQERGTGKFLRTLTLPSEVDDTNVSAEYVAGILRITLPKAEAARPRRITVSVS